MKAASFLSPPFDARGLPGATALSQLSQRPCFHHRRSHGFSLTSEIGRVRPVNPKNIADVEVILFLRGLLRHLPVSDVLINDSSSIHYQRLMQDYVQRRCSQLQVYCFPVYAPELNLAEYAWSNGKRYLSNGTPEDIDQLAGRVRIAIRKVVRSNSFSEDAYYIGSLF
jgi:hypothetical protein